jgi:hypothetical protein
MGDFQTAKVLALEGLSKKIDINKQDYLKVMERLNEHLYLRLSQIDTIWELMSKEEVN